MELVMGNAFVSLCLKFFRIFFCFSLFSYIFAVKLDASFLYHIHLILDSFHLLERYVWPFMFHAIFTRRIIFCSFISLHLCSTISINSISEGTFLSTQTSSNRIELAIESFGKPQHCTHTVITFQIHTVQGKRRLSAVSSLCYHILL